MKLIVGTNSYVTISEADKIIANYLTSGDSLLSAYENLDDEDKSVVLYKGCLDMQRLRYRGFKQDKNQTLSFPRINKLGYKSDDDMVKLAQVVNALSFISGGSSTSSQIGELKDNGVSSFKLGAFSISLHGQSSQKSNSGKVENFLSEWLMGSVPIR